MPSTPSTPHASSPLPGSGRYELVTIAASAGGIEACRRSCAALPARFPVPIAIVLHRTATEHSLLTTVLSRGTPLGVKLVEEGERLRPGTVYLAPPALHLQIGPGPVASLSKGTKIRHVRSSANPLFSSAAAELEGRVLAVVLSGGDRDGTDGVQTVHAHGGTVLVQDEATSRHFGMPQSAIQTGCVDRVLPLGEIAPTLVRLVTEG